MSTGMIPIGFSFCPTYEIIIKNYLINKITGKSLPYNGIIERDLYGSDPPWQVLRDDDPWIVSEKNKKSIYVFTCLKYVSETCRNRVARAAGCGSWMGKTGGKVIFEGVSGPLIGKKEMLVFESNDEKLEGTRGYWSMYEFTLAGSNLDLIKGRSSNKIYVVCKITKDESKFLKILPLKTMSRKRKAETDDTHNNKESDMSKKGSRKKKKGSYPISCVELEDDFVTSGLKSEIITCNKSYSQELENQNSQEWSSLSVLCVGMEGEGFQTQSYDENLFTYGSYEQDFFDVDTMFDSSELWGMIETDEGATQNHVSAQEFDDKGTMRFGGFDGAKCESTPLFSSIFA